MRKPSALILTGYGINCDYEVEEALRLAGAETLRLHINDLIERPERLAERQILVFPGGFSYGDDIAAGRVLANKFITNLREPLARFIEGDKLVIGICNGFQVIVKLGLITANETPLTGQTVTLTNNDSCRYEARWTRIKAEAGNRSVWLRGIDSFDVPVAHGEGKFFAPDATLDEMEANGQIVLRYVNPDDSPASGVYPQNPNGSPRDIAGVCDRTGRILGLMPHPERFLYFTNHPRQTALAETYKRRGLPVPEEGAGRKMFKNAVDFFG